MEKNDINLNTFWQTFQIYKFGYITVMEMGFFHSYVMDLHLFQKELM